jgi:hypothetical protein
MHATKVGSEWIGVKAVNISSLFRSMMGDPQVSEAKAIELKPGQVVRGVVQQDLGNQEALITINGVQVRAKLEAPLQQGEATMLQVQDESSTGQIVLKPIAINGNGSSDIAFTDLLKSFGLKDTPANRDLILQMQSAGVPITKENVAKFAEMLAIKPSNIDVKPWIQAMAVANARGLTMSTSVLLALTEVLSESNSLTNRLSTLENEVRSVLLNQSGMMSDQTKAGLGKMLQILQQLNQLGPDRDVQAEAGSARPQSGSGNLTYTGSGSLQGTQPAGTTGTASNGQTISSASVPGGQLAATQASTIGNTGPTAGSPQTGSTGQGSNMVQVPAGTTSGSTQIPGNAQSPASAVVQANSAASVMPKSMPAATPSGIGSGTMPQSLAQSEGAVTTVAQSSNQEIGVLQGRAQAAAMEQPNASGTQGQQAASHSAGNLSSAESSGRWIGNALKLLGIDHEQLFSKGVMNQQGAQAAANTLLQADEAHFEITQLGKESVPTLRTIDQAQQLPGDSLKSLLMTLLKSEDVPPALKEVMGNTVQQITGQQLLLSAERNSPLTHLTLFIPFTNENGQQTASVHIQSRKKGRDTLDPANCRLLFDLNMQAMGDTLVDVQVVNSIVSLQIHNDHPVIPQLLEASREEIASGLEAMGYQFMSLSSKPFPDLTRQRDIMASNVTNEASKDPHAYYQPKPYKGVDLRV